MDINENADIDTSQIEDRRGAGGGGGLGGIPIPIGGGKGGLLITVVAILLTLVGGGVIGGNMLGGDGGGDNTALDERCGRDNPDRLRQADCRNALFVNSIQDYWQEALPASFGQQYSPAKTVFFSQGVSTGCGNAGSGVGPFYCPADRQIYIDLRFYDELANRFGAEGQFAQPYVLAHEYGHHVQTLLGTEAQVRRAQQRDPGNAQAYSVRLELQADCYSGVWTKHATETADASGQPLFTSITTQDVREAQDAAAAVGDDTIAQRSGGAIDESQFTHGSAEQRQRWFTRGYDSGDPKACDTFSNPA